MKTAFATLVAACFLLVAFPPAGALLGEPLAGPNDAPDIRCEHWSAAEIAENHGVMTETFPTATPGLTVTIHALCVLDEIPVVTAQTDCTATSYSLTGWSWSSPYSGLVDTTNSYGFSSADVVSNFNAGSNTWDVQVPADIFGSIAAGGKAKDIRKFNGINQHGWKGLGGGGTIAVTYTWSSGGNAVESDAAYNTFYSWSLTGEANKMDLLNIQTHEIGHTFGLGHSTSAAVNSCLTMYPSGTFGETQKRTLGDGDILGIKAIY